MSFDDGGRKGGIGVVKGEVLRRGSLSKLIMAGVAGTISRTAGVLYQSAPRKVG